MPARLMPVLRDAVKIVNIIKARPLLSRLFAALCNEMGCQHVLLLIHTKIRWQSRGKVSSASLNCGASSGLFIHDRPFESSPGLEDMIWLQRLSYLTYNIFRPNHVNLGQQGVLISTYNTHDSIHAIVKKLESWKACTQENVFECLSMLHELPQ